LIHQARSRPGALFAIGVATYYDPGVHPLVVQTEREIAGRRLFKPGETLLAAVSGGLDSMVMLSVLCELLPSPATHLVVGHFDHGLRGRASTADAAFVKRHADQLGLRCVIEPGDVKALTRAKRLSMEMAARQARHQFLARTAQAVEAQVIVLGHHRDDQIELFFLRLLRGAGGAGLGGMQWVSPSPANPQLLLIRPFLMQTRAALEEYAKEHQVPFRRDASNRRLEPLRNRIRHRLLPLLRREYQSAVDDTVWRSMEILGSQADFASQTAARWLLDSNPVAFEHLHAAVQREAIRSQLWSLGASADFELVEELRRTSGRPVAVSSGVTVARDGSGRIRPIRSVHMPFAPAEAELDLKGRGGETQFAGVTIRWQRIARAGVCQQRPAQSGMELFDAAKVGNTVLLRHWRRGDRFQPIGMAAPLKLQDLFVNAKIERSFRHELVVATTASGELFWVEGLRMAEGFKLDKQSRQRLKWQWQRSGQWQ
jgi:tRNA(Ile)-lysidine synthase